ncbi:unnamed protein product, partial [Adineta ricciae]
MTYSAWDPNATTFASCGVIGTRPHHVFVDIDDTVYITVLDMNVVQVWPAGSDNVTRVVSGNLDSPATTFVTANGDIYVDNGDNGQVDKWTLNATEGKSVFNVLGQCMGLFIDVNNTIYCSMDIQHLVLAKLLDDNSNKSMIVAGNGTVGSESNSLNMPNGIFVDKDLYLYVADWGNNRVQRFPSRQLEATTVAGNGAPGTVSLAGPIAVVLDGDGYLFIVEWYTARVVASGPHGFRCIVGCTGTIGSTADTLAYPRSISFDSYGNIYVLDNGNRRVQKFLFLNNSCDPSSTLATFTIPTVDVFEMSFNQPQFCSGALWNSNGTTFADNSTISSELGGIFVDINDSIYLVMRNINAIRIWYNGDANSTRTISSNSTGMLNIFVTINGDIYTSNIFDGNITRWTMNATESKIDAVAFQSCTAIFISLNNYLYCSMFDTHQVIKISLNDANSSSAWIVVAGNATAGSAPNTLCLPKGIFVDKSLNLYVADWSNNRIQEFRYGQLDGITLAGTGAPSTIQLTGPTDVIVDSNNYLFIVDWGGHRIVKSGPDGFGCLLGCTGTHGQASDQLYYPSWFAFDHFGNIYVTDDGNMRIQKFTLIYNNCNQTTTNEVVTTYAETSTYSTDPISETSSFVGNEITTLESMQLSSTTEGDSFSTDVSSVEYDEDTTEELQASTEGLYYTYTKKLVTSLHSLDHFSTMQSTFMDTTQYTEVTILSTVETTNDEISTINLNYTTEEHSTFSAIETSTTDENYFSTDEHFTINTDKSTEGFFSTVQYSETSTDKRSTININNTTTTVQTSIEEVSTGTQQYTMTTSLDTVQPSTTISELENISSIIPGNYPTYNCDKYFKDKYLECFSSMISFLPNNTSLLTPAQYRRSDNILINHIINNNCTPLHSYFKQWIVTNCTSSCEFQVNINYLLNITTNQILIPARTLPYGVYRLKLVLTMINSTATIIASSSVYIAIIPATIIVNLVQYGTSVITSSYENDLILDPGKYSINPDSDIFDATNWNYTYYCQTDDTDNMIIDGALISFEEPNHPCFLNKSNNSRGWSYSSLDVPQSAVIIFAGSLLSNRTYRFLVNMVHHENSHVQANGYVSVNVENVKLPMIAVACVIQTMCSASLQYQYINPTTQIALFSVCIGNCTLLTNIAWNIYQGSINFSTNIVTWVRLSLFFNNSQLFGTNTRNLTVPNHLFSQYTNGSYWRFEVVYTFNNKPSLGALDFVMNQPPRSGSCSINPPNGTTITLFQITCSNWFDENGIKDYSFYGEYLSSLNHFNSIFSYFLAYTTDSTKQIMLGFTNTPSFQVRLPSSITNTSIVNIIVSIKDGLNAITQVQLQPVIVYLDWTEINTFIDIVEHSNSKSTNRNLIAQLLANGDANSLTQIVTLISEFLNEMSEQQTENAVKNGVPFTSISVSFSNIIDQFLSSTTLNVSTFKIFTDYLNQHAVVRDYLITNITNLSITTWNSIALQSSALSQLTNAPNELTRTTSILASTKCYQLSIALQSMADQISYEELQKAAQSIVQCAANVYTAINEPLQDRGIILDLDFNRANMLPDDYDTDLESVWSNLKLFAIGDDYSWNTIQQGRNRYYQKQTANTINHQLTEIISSITAAFEIHLNIGQKIVLNTTSMFFSLEKLSFESLPNKLLLLNGNARIKLPANLNLIENSADIVLLRSIMLPLAPKGNSPPSTYTNLSTLISLSVIDLNNNEIHLSTKMNDSIEYLIPRDVNAQFSSIILQNVTAMSNFNRTFNLHYVNLTRMNNLSISLHIEMYPIDIQLAYMFIYKFDDIPQLNRFDGRSLFCPSDLMNDSFYTYFINNEYVSSHQSIIFGFRQLNSMEIDALCSNISMQTNPSMISFNNSFNFSSNYKLRLYTSGCYYLDSNNNWLSDGLIVGSLTNLVQTQCFSTRAETLAGALHLLPSPIDWSYVFAHASFSQNKTIYVTITSVLFIYFVLIVYARAHDKYDLKQLEVSILASKAEMNGYAYQIIVFTGFRANANTESKVHFVMVGKNDKTSIRTFSSSHRKIFQRGGIDSFIITTPKSLGSLEYIHIWHDNSGQGSAASWFLKHIIVRDLQTMKEFYFICQRWLAVEHDNGAVSTKSNLRIERLLSVASENEKQNYSNILSKKVYENLSDRHLWFSIFSRLTSKKFTRVQRCTCCIVLFFITMLFNILYYREANQSEHIKYNISITIGPFYISLQQVIIGMIMEIFSLIPSVFLVQFFRRIRSKGENRKAREITFPWWCTYFAYGISFLFIGTSLLFILVRSIELGDLQVQKWLTSILAGFISSACLTQPLQILIITIFTIICFRKEDNQRQSIDDYILNRNEEYIHTIEDRSLSYLKINRLNKAETTIARHQRFRQIRIRAIIEEIGLYLIYLGTIYFLAYYNYNTNVFL